MEKLVQTYALCTGTNRNHRKTHCMYEMLFRVSSNRRRKAERVLQSTQTTKHVPMLSWANTAEQGDAEDCCVIRLFWAAN